MDVPFISPPESSNLNLLRSPGTRRSLAAIPADQLQAVPELAVGDAFEQNQEFIAVRAERVVAAIITHTCNLEAFSTWLFAPVKSFEGNDQEYGTLWRLEFVSSFPVAESVSAGLPKSYIDLENIRSVDQRSLKSGIRIGSMQMDIQRELGDHVARFFGRVWGESSGSPAPQDGKYRCLRDVYFTDLPMEPLIIDCNAGDLLPECPNCKKAHKTAQWQLLTKFKRRS